MTHQLLCVMGDVKGRKRGYTGCAGRTGLHAVGL